MSLRLIPESLEFLAVDLLAIQQQGLDRALFSYSFIREVRLNGVRPSITIVHIPKFCRMQQNIVRFLFFSE